MGTRLIVGLAAATLLSACVDIRGGGSTDGAVGSCDPMGSLWLSDCSRGCGPLMTCMASCPSCDTGCHIPCDSDFECARYGAGFCRSASCSACRRVCSQAPTSCDAEVNPGAECTDFDGPYCTCTSAPASNHVACGPSELSGSVCCADPTWPAPDSQCTCDRPEVLCSRHSYTWGTRCECDTGPAPSELRVDTCTGVVCCIIEEERQCLCVSEELVDDCAGRPTVPSCQPGYGQSYAAGCDGDWVEIASCSDGT